MDEFRVNAYERADLYKERMKKYHDRRIIQRNFKKGDLVLLFNSRLKLFPGKLKSKWSGPFRISQVHSSGVVELENNDGSVFKVNGQRVKLYIGPTDLIKCIATIYLDEVSVIEITISCRDNKSSATWEATHHFTRILFLVNKNSKRRVDPRPKLRRLVGGNPSF